eukprot:4904897-Prymnesium_polylepis.1
MATRLEIMGVVLSALHGDAAAGAPGNDREAPPTCTPAGPDRSPDQPRWPMADDVRMARCATW